ncbi:ATPase, partial [Sphingomonas sp. HMWF008]
MSETSPHVARLREAVGAVERLLEDYARSRSRGIGRPDRPAPADLGAPVDGSALDALAKWFSLSTFEVAVIALAAGFETSPDMANLCALAQGDPAAPYPTTLLALAVFADLEGASQARFAPTATLRHWHLITLDQPDHISRLQTRFGLPDAMLSFLVGEPVVDAALAEMIRPLELGPQLPADTALARRLARTLRTAGEGAALHLAAEPSRRALGIVAGAAAALRTTPFVLPLASLTAEVVRDGFFRLWQRDRLALGGALIVSFEEAPGEVQLTMLARLIGELSGPLFLVGTGGQSIAVRAPGAVIRVSLPREDPGEVADHLAPRLGQSVSPDLREITTRFRLPLPTLESCAAVARATAEEAGEPAPVEATQTAFLRLLRDQVREAMSGLADPITVRMTLEDLVVPTAARTVLDQVIARQRNRSKVMEEWGFATSGGGPQGMSVLFAGPSGTGKTMAAEALAHALSLDLYRVDLSRIVDKYIGETEKRLSALFDAAESTDAILLFDEADVLFGRRTEVRDSHDHYANLEVGYLLQRIEAFRGIAILTTNLANAIDEAFARRFAFSLHFEFPSVDERRRIWRGAFPAAAPVAGLDWDRLARLTLTGGQIRVVSLNAAMLAANEADAISMRHV